VATFNYSLTQNTYYKIETLNSVYPYSAPYRDGYVPTTNNCNNRVFTFDSQIMAISAINIQETNPLSDFDYTTSIDYTFPSTSRLYFIRKDLAPLTTTVTSYWS
jgi:hypothetical protein